MIGFPVELEVCVSNLVFHVGHAAFFVNLIFLLNPG